MYGDAVQKVRFGNFEEAHALLLVNIWLKEPGAHHAVDLHSCCECVIFILKTCQTPSQW